MSRQPRRSFSLSFSATLLLTLTFLGSAALAQLRAGGIDNISPAKGRKGDIVTIQGHGFGSRNVTVTVAGIPAQIIQATGFSVTFRLPDGVQPGQTQVVCTNPGFQTGSIEFRILEGILLPGDPAALLKDTSLNLPGQGVGSDQILNSIILTRVDVRFLADATVAQVNNLLQQIDGGIVARVKGSTFLTIAIPQQQSIAAIRALVQTVEGFPGVAFALLAQVPQNEQIFVSTDQVGNLMQHLLPGRFPAAWNALPPGIVTNGLCSIPPIPLLIADVFGSQPPSDVPAGVTISSFPPPQPPPSNFTGDGDHGYYVALVAAAEGVGANPFLPSGCLALRPVQTAGQDIAIAINRISAAMPAGKFIVNQSQGFQSLCQGFIDTACVPPQDILKDPLGRAAMALYWKEQTKVRWPDFLMVVSAGNSKGSPAAVIYPGMGDSRFNWFATIAQLPDPRFNWVQDGGLWDPNPLFASAGFTSLLPTDPQFSYFQQVVDSTGLGGADSIADNVIAVGSATSQSSSSILTQHVTGDQLGESVFSDSNADVLAVGEAIFFPKNLIGTSFAAPQVAGLASYLWMLSPDLQSQPAAVTKRAIVANTRNRVVDAYAAALSLDAAALPNPQNAKVRLTLLDVNGDGGFNEADIDIFLRHFFIVAPDGTISHQAQPGTTADFSRFDLNGDGFTTAGARRERFDLDRVDSIQFGQTNYSTVSQTIEGTEIHFDETALTDLEILCYYAYSDMFQGNPDARKSLLAGRCGLSVQPATATVNVSQKQQFTAVTPVNDSVTWTVTPGCGSIDQNGVFTASTAGTCTVKATDNNDPNQVGTATVTVKVGATKVALLSRTCFTNAQGVLGFNTVNLAQQVCPQYLNAQGNNTPPPPYSVPQIAISGPASAGVFSFQANYTENLSKTEVEGNALTGGTLDIVAQVDAAQIQDGQTTNPPIVAVTAEAGLNFTPVDQSVYRIRINGQISADFSFTNHVMLTFSTDSPNIAPVTIALDESSGGSETPITQSFTVPPQLFATGGAIDPATGQFLPTQVHIGLLTQAEISARTDRSRTSRSEINLTFSIDKVQ